MHLVVSMLHVVHPLPAPVEPQIRNTIIYLLYSFNQQELHSIVIVEGSWLPSPTRVRLFLDNT